jgi:hypothetical protein
MENHGIHFSWNDYKFRPPPKNIFLKVAISMWLFSSRFAQQDLHVHEDDWWNTKTLKVTWLELSCIFKSLEKLLLMLWLSLWSSSCKLNVKEIMKKKNLKFVFEFFMSNVWWSVIKEHIQRFQLKFFPPRAQYIYIHGRSFIGKIEFMKLMNEDENSLYGYRSKIQLH